MRRSAGCRLTADRVVITSGTSEGIELALTALAEAGDEVLIPTPTYPLYTAVLAKIGARAVFYRTEPAAAGSPTSITSAALVTPAHARAGRHRSEQSDRRHLSRRDAPGAARDRRRAATSRCSPTRSTPTSRSTARCPRSRAQNPDAPVITFSSLSKAYLAPGWRSRLDGGRPHGPARRRAGGREEAGGRTAVQHRTDGVRACRRAHRRPLAPGGRSATRLRERAVLSHQRLNAIDGITSVVPSAAFYAMPKVALPAGVTDEDYVLALLRATGVLCVYGSGFDADPADGFFRVVFLASPAELSDDLRPDRGIHPGLPRGPGPLVTTDLSPQKSLIRYAILMTALTAIVLWAAYNVRNVLLLLYISGLLAIGFSPIVRLIERQKLLPVCSHAISALARDPRPLPRDHRRDRRPRHARRPAARRAVARQLWTQPFRRCSSAPRSS